MRRSSAKLLEDVRGAVALIDEFVEGKGFEDYCASPLLRAWVERQFEIMGEALNRLSKTDPELAGMITNAHRIVAFRNILIHGYDAVDDAIVWDVIESHVPVLREQVAQMLRDADW